MKNYLRVFVLLMAVWFLYGCRSEKIAEKYDFGNNTLRFEEQIKKIDHSFNNYLVYQDTVYIIEDHETICFSGKDLTKQKTLAFGGKALDIYNGYYYIFDDTCVKILNGNLEQVSIINVSSEEYGRKYLKATHNWIVYAYPDAFEDIISYRIFAGRLKDGVPDGEITEITDMIQGSMPWCHISDIAYESTEVVSVVFDYNPTDSSSTMFVKIDLEKMTILDRFFMEGINNYTIYDGVLYGITNQIDYPQIFGYDLTTKEKSIIKSVDTQSIVKEADCKNDFLVGRAVVTIENLILFYPDNGFIKVFERSNDGSVIRILIPDSGYPMSNFYYVYKNVVSSFEAETGAKVEFYTIPAEEYETKLLLKLLSNENDFDLYLIPNAVNTSVFRSIVEKKAYYSLKDAEALKDVYPLYFDGYEQMITVNDDICGIPMHITHNCLEINRELFDLYDLPIPNTDWTLDDLWNLCDIIYERGLNIKALANGELQLIRIVAECLEYTDFDADALESLFAKIHDYSQKSTLAFDNEPGAFYYSLNRDKPALFYQAKDYYAVPDAGSARKNHENYIPFPRYNTYAPHYMRVFDILAVNANSHDTENSIRFLSALMQSKIGNMKNCHKDQICDFDKLVVKNSRIHCLYNDEMFEQTKDVYMSLLHENIDPEKSAKDFLSAILYKING